ncbi:hypothetical protein AHAS_Ahas19G0325400 [Arachis hypogaea]
MDSAQKNYATIKKEILAIVLCISRFQEDLFNKTFLIKTDCKPSDLFKTKPLSEEHPYHEKVIPLKIMALEKNGSIELTHNKGSTTKDIIFSKIKITKVITLSKWERPSFHCKSFTRKFEPQHYSYYDYMDAWWNTLYLSSNPHSWFIWFRKRIFLQFPKRFQIWFQKFRPIEAIFSKEASMTYEYFKNKTSFLDGYKLISFIPTTKIC